VGAQALLGDQGRPTVIRPMGSPALVWDYKCAPRAGFRGLPRQCRRVVLGVPLMFAALFLAAGFAASSHAPARSLDQRVSLLEARQMLESQSLWSLQSALHPDALKAVADVELHVAQDRERDEALRAMMDRVQMLERRLQAIELMMGDRAVLEGQLRLAPEPGAQRGDIGAPVIHPRTARLQAKGAPKPAHKVSGQAKARKAGTKQAASLAGARFADAKR
jgi:hypothetical protein